MNGCTVHFADLNDPFEGVYLAGSQFPLELLEREDLEPLLESIGKEPANKKFDWICSLSGNFQDIRLWSHYGDGHRGIAIEIDFTDHEADAKPVRYVGRFENYGETKPESVPVYMTKINVGKLAIEQKELVARKQKN